MTPSLLPRARLRDVVKGHAPFVGARLGAESSRGWVSPVEARLLLGISYDDLAAEEARYLARRTLRSDLAVVLRTAVAHALAPRRSAEAVRRPWIVSADVDNITLDEAVEGIFAPPGGDRARIVHFVHAHALNVASRDPELGERLARAQLTLPDGVGIRLAALILGIAMRHNINGTDLWPRLFHAAATRAIPVALVGGAPGVAEASAERLVRESPGLQVALVSDGYLSEHGSREVAARLRSLGRCLVFVGMGTPRQEAWAWTYLADAREATVLTVGGLFDFVSGRVPRAPLAWRELGLEWLFRLIQEPRRLAMRYLVGNPLFLARVLRQRLDPRQGIAARLAATPRRER